MVNKVSVFDVSIYSHRYPMFHILHCFTLFHSITGGPGFPLGLCEGDCDDDSECQVCILLVCIQSMRSYFYSTLRISSFLFTLLSPIPLYQADVVVRDRVFHGKTQFPGDCVDHFFHALDFKIDSDLRQRVDKNTGSLPMP